MPCPPWLGRFLSNPYTNKLAGAELLLDRAEVSPGMRVLDVGPGWGRVTIPAAQRVGAAGSVVALDVQEAMLERVRAAALRQRLENVVTVKGSIEAGVPGAGDFDRALLVTVLGEIPDRETALRALHAALRAGGLLSITELVLDPHYQSKTTLRRLAGAAGFRFERTFGSWLAYTMNFRKPSP